MSLDYEALAEVFVASMAETASVADALRVVVRAINRSRPHRSGRPSRVSPDQLVRLRRLRAEGCKLTALAVEHGLSEARISQLCRGVIKRPRQVAL